MDTFLGVFAHANYVHLELGLNFWDFISKLFFLQKIALICSWQSDGFVYQADGTCKMRDRQDLVDELGNFLVMERNGAVIGCAALQAFESDHTAEVYAFAIHPTFRGQGRGDRLLESLELAARQRIPGIRNMFLLTTRTMDWFYQRGYTPVGPAHLSSMLPCGKKVDSSRNSKMYVKVLEEQ
mmetsp:Transcript_30301/g.57118  ORF Transcript_30301/g.57118 Transcript_30301/m.57118 type:complete len:182 (-) Transcript_30301:342-887(-)